MNTPPSQHTQLAGFWKDNGDRFKQWWIRMTVSQRGKVIETVGIVEQGQRSADTETTLNLLAPELSESELCLVVTDKSPLMHLYEKRTERFTDQMAADLAFSRVLHDTGLVRESDPTAFVSVHDGKLFKLENGADKDDAAVQQVQQMMQAGAVVPASVFEASTIRRSIIVSFLQRLAAEFVRLEGQGLAITVCAYCGAVESEQVKLKVCARCRSVAYCSQEHQKAHWKAIHKPLCLCVEPKDGSEEQ